MDSESKTVRLTVYDDKGEVKEVADVKFEDLAREMRERRHLAGFVRPGENN